MKIGRNDPCHCGSGRKFKRCHGSGTTQGSRKPTNVQPIPGYIRDAFLTAEATRLRRERQQGLGKPIISAEIGGTRFVAIGTRLAYSDKFKTFHDFLGEYIKVTLGADWGNRELGKPLEDRHPILQWYQLLCILQREFIKEPGKVHSGPMTGAAAAYLGLAYDLYALDHNAELQRRLVERLKDRDQFPGALYETFVAASMLRAGFNLEFENESDRSTTHCEFTATSKSGGHRYSVEAKHRQPTNGSDAANNKFRLGRLLHKALGKRAKNDRVVFIDINVPDAASENGVPSHLSKALSDLRKFEGRQWPSGEPLPPAYLFVTNFPYQYNLEKSGFRRSVIAEGFQIPDFKGDAAFASLRGALDARDRHLDMFRLADSLLKHSTIPSTFDGNIPEFAFRKAKNRLVVGQVYLVKDNAGIERRGKLTSAAVDEAKRLAWGVYSLENGQQVIATSPMSDAEIQAYRQYPDTFFGTLMLGAKRSKTPIDLYDFFFSSYQHTPKERLLEFLASAPDQERLKKLSQQDLAKYCCEWFTYGVLKLDPPRCHDQSTRLQ